MDIVHRNIRTFRHASIGTRVSILPSSLATSTVPTGFTTLSIHFSHLPRLFFMNDNLFFFLLLYRSNNVSQLPELYVGNSLAVSSSHIASHEKER